MKNLIKKKSVRFAFIVIVILGLGLLGLSLTRKSNADQTITRRTGDVIADFSTLESLEADRKGYNIENGAEQMPVYGNWKNFTVENGLPDDKAYTVRIDGDRVLVGTHHGLAVYENGNWHTYTTEDGLAHNGVVSIDVSVATGDVWIGTLGGLNRWSAGKFETFDQFNSGMPNDLVYNVFCFGKDVWVATCGGAGHYDTYTNEWEIFTEQNAPMHEPWTYAVSME